MKCIVFLALAVLALARHDIIFHPGSQIIPGRYIVSLKHDDVSTAAVEEHHKWIQSVLEDHPESTITHVYNTDKLKGYAGTFNDQVLEKLRHNDAIEYIEHDQVINNRERLAVRYLEEEIVQEKDSFFPRQRPSVQENAPWGISRVSSRPIPEAYGNYSYPVSAGNGIDVYVIDTGIYVEHSQFEGRAKWGTSFISWEGDFDGNGHGTHCAGTIGGKDFGVAKNVNLIAVKVLSSGGSGSMSGVVGGIEWVVKEHLKNPKAKSVASMSLGGGRSPSLDRAVDVAVKKGVHFAVAAGNENQDAFDIASAWIGDTDAVNVISGTSMATPHVAGVIALYLAIQDLNPTQLKKELVSDSTKDVIKGLPKRTINALLNTNELFE
ncbi:Peptidase S8/S53 domain-containing protein [Rozella allomycis CSF55]|uniref:Peptidase S8/S53 domain-containing protein n=1 Tax=Rozella allomycis (strain CSF55) TaxID=988480 RepID=A0A075AVL0_ROZAC|nr:Peptidase S8/S53 domain-containing protein [Rozella allomycis CSF55]|eukprot:EPZ32569.1 Peptidase S8/S53 domain-containing protein [Rozella allomycis CSF55]